MIAHSHYEEDPRVRREAESLVERGRPVDVYALRREDQPADELLDGVRVIRLGVERHQGAGIATYLREYLSFLGRAGWAVSRSQRRRRYAVVQVHSLPDFLGFAGLPLRLTGVPIVLDLHEAMPEFFAMRFPKAASPAAHRALLVQERLSIGLARAVITVNEALADRLVSLGVARDKITVILNSPSRRHFDPSRQPIRPFMADGVLRLVYAGALTPTYELDVVLEALALVRARRPELAWALELYGRGDAEPALRAQVERLGLDQVVRFGGRIPIAEVPAVIAAADVGLAPTRRNAFTEMSLSTKVFEYGALDRPIVASRLPLVARTFGADAVATYAPGQSGDLADVLLAQVDEPQARERRVRLAAARIAELSWEREADRLMALIDGLAHDRA
ncbi:MAG TPA: glycosyltransferase family 4 protein [Candidatus Limnocylindrales bacterium]|jgi:glycosyltransferase involved in cell wall biosynthesis